MKKLGLLAVAIVAGVAVFGALTQASFTIGNQAIGATLDSGDSNYLNGIKVTTGTSGGAVVTMSVYVGAIDGAPNNQFEIGIYADSAGRPGTLVATSAPATLTANAWNTVAPSSSASLQANTTYWLIFNTNGRTSTLNNMRYGAGAAGSGVYSNNSVTYGAWPSPFGAATVTDSAYSIYVTIDGNAGPPPESVYGWWAPLQTWPIVAIHGAVLRTGKVLVWDEEVSTTHPRVWDPVTETLSSTPAVADELWCAGNIVLTNGNVLSVGGHRVGAGESGINSTYQYNPLTNTWAKTGNLGVPALVSRADGPH